MNDYQKIEENLDEGIIPEAAVPEGIEENLVQFLEYVDGACQYIRQAAR